MSTLITAHSTGKTFQIEINDDLEMIFLDRDIRYDETLSALGGTKSTALELYERWIDTPANVVIENFDLSKQNITLMIADWAEHVWPIFHIVFPDDEHIHKAIVITKKFAHTTTFQQPVESAWYNTMVATNDANNANVRHAHSTEAAVHAALAAQDAINSLLSPDNWKDLANNVSEYSLQASAFEALDRDITVDFQGSVAYKAESDWQISHAMKVIEYAQGKRSNWPEIEVSPWA